MWKKSETLPTKPSISIYRLFRNKLVFRYTISLWIQNSWIAEKEVLNEVIKYFWYTKKHFGGFDDLTDFLCILNRYNNLDKYKLLKLRLMGLKERQPYVLILKPCHIFFFVWINQSWLVSKSLANSSNPFLLTLHLSFALSCTYNVIK